MKKLIGCTFLFAIDRLLKYWAATYCFTDLRIASWLTLDVTFNRGITWGLFSHDSTVIFSIVSMIVLGVIVYLSWYTYQRWQQRQAIFGELLVLTGALSNMIDRVVYHGVVDFIQFTLFGYHYPAFNLADAYIVCGIVIIFFNMSRAHE